MLESLPELLVALATVIAGTLGLFFATPQLYKTFSTKKTEGISVVGYLNGAISYILWTLYFLVYQRPFVALSIALPGVFWITTLFLIVVYKHRAKERILTKRLVLPVVWLCIGLAAWFGGGAYLDAALSTSILWAYLPSLWAAYRSDDVSGISLTTWALTGVHSTAVIVAGYPLFASVLYGFFGVFTAAVVVCLVLTKRKNQPA